MVIEVLPLLIAFAATLVGILGNTWDKRRKGLGRLTATGWLVVVFATLSLAVSAYQARAAAFAKQEQERKAELLRTLARDDVLDALWAIVDPFERLVDAKNGKANEADPVGQAINERLYTPIEHLGEMGTVAFLEYLDGVKVLECPPDLADRPGCTWAGIFGIAAWRGDGKLKDVAARYSEVLDPPTLELIQTIRSHKMLDILKAAPANVETNREIGHNNLDAMSVGWLLRGPHEPSAYFIPFFGLLNQLSGNVGIRTEEPDKYWLEKSKR
jgi:hypothetical protein